MKLIKFDLPINGTKVRDLEELRDNLTDEIVALARSGQLERWLRTRQLPEQAQAVATVLQSESTDKDLFLALCGVLEVEAHPDDVNAIFDVPPSPGRLIYEARYLNSFENNELVELQVPELSNFVGEANLLVWKKKIGEKILENEVVIEIETDKVVLEVCAPSDGVLYEILVDDGGVVDS